MLNRKTVILTLFIMVMMFTIVAPISAAEKQKFKIISGYLSASGYSFELTYTVSIPMFIECYAFDSNGKEIGFTNDIASHIGRNHTSFALGEKTRLITKVECDAQPLK